MKQDKFADLSPEERLQALRDTATKTEKASVKRHYTADELEQMKDFVSTESTSLMEKEEEFSEIRKEFTKATKEQKHQIRGCLKDMKRGYSDQEEEVFMFDDQEEGLMYIYDSKGVFLSSRKLYADERQTKIVAMERAAS